MYQHAVFQKFNYKYMQFVIELSFDIQRLKLCNFNYDETEQVINLIDGRQQSPAGMIKF